jgi:hypothetical protein
VTAWIRRLPPSPIDVAVYLDTDDDARIDRVLGAVHRVEQALGYVHVGAASVRRGSILARWRARSVELVTSSEFESRLAQLEAAFWTQLERRRPR